MRVLPPPPMVVAELLSTTFKLRKIRSISRAQGVFLLLDFIENPQFFLKSSSKRPSGDHSVIIAYTSQAVSSTR